MTKENLRSVLRGAAFVWLSATLLEGTILAAQERIPFVFSMMSAAIRYAWLGVLAVPVWQMCWRMGEVSWSRLRRAATHMAMGVLVLALWVGGYVGFLYVVTQGEILVALRESTLWQAFGALFSYVLLVVGIVAAQSAIRLRAQRERETDLTLLAREAEVKALKAQLHPHFMFNTLNSIYALIESRPSDAQEMVGRLGELLRKTLEAAEERLVPLSWELELVNAYIAIEKIRLGDRLSVVVDAESVDPDTPVLPFVLQPIVENAIKHGIARRRDGGEVVVRVRRRGDELELRVEDTGPGLAEHEDDADGRGLELTRRRLETTYGAESYRLELENRLPRGLGVTLTFAVPS